MPYQISYKTKSGRNAVVLIDFSSYGMAHRFSLDLLKRDEIVSLTIFPKWLTARA